VVGHPGRAQSGEQSWRIGEHSVGVRPQVVAQLRGAAAGCGQVGDLAEQLSQECG